MIGMGKTQFYTATSIDGFIADAKNSLDWLFESGTPDDPGNQGFPAFFAQVGAFCMGATTYEWILDHDQLLSNPGKWKQYYGDVPCWVFTHRSLPAIQGASLQFVSGDVVPVHDDMLSAVSPPPASRSKKPRSRASSSPQPIHFVRHKHRSLVPET
jgi:dihydrofolate reductase